MDEVINQIENIKEKLTSDEYKNLLESLQQVYNQQQNVKFEVFFATVYFELEHIDVYIKPQLRRIVLSQPNFPHVFHTKEGDYYKIYSKWFINSLSEENQDIYSNIIFVDEKDPHYEDYDVVKATICYDTEDFVYVRFLKGDMDDSNIPEDSDGDSDEES